MLLSEKALQIEQQIETVDALIKEKRQKLYNSRVELEDLELEIDSLEQEIEALHVRSLLLS